MKNLLLLACLLACVLNAHAQYDSTATVIDSTDYEFPQKWQRLYQNVPTDSAHTGYFIDRVLWLNNHPARFNGIIDTSGRDLNSTDTVYFEAIANLHQGLIGAYVGNAPNAVLFDSTDLLLQKAITYAKDTLLPLAVMRMNYNFIRDSAFLDSILYLDLADTSIKPVLGNYNNPFAQATLFAAAPAWGELEQDHYKLILPHDLILNNTEDTVVKGRFWWGNKDYGDGDEVGDIYTELPIDQPVLVDWSHMEGTHILWVEVLFSNGIWYRSLAPINFLGKKQPYTGIYANAGTTINIAPSNQHAGATAEIRYGCGKTKLTKPLIIIEGFDPDSENDMNSFLTQIADPDNITVYQRIQELEAQGYDMVFINFNNSMDSIERNTRIFKEVVQQLNTIKANNGSTETNMVMGFSMGGLIGRMGLREMELQNIPHQTEAYISVDAPHRGAHIPKSLQYLVRDIQHILDFRIKINALWVNLYTFSLKNFTKPEDLTEFNKALYTITSPASKQMLIDNIFDYRVEWLDKVFPVDTPGSIYHTHETYKNFYYKYDSIGQPQNCQVFAITNGSIAGQRQHDGNGIQIVDGAQQALINQQNINVLSSTWTWQLWAALAGVWPTLDVYFELNAQPNNLANQLIYKSGVKLSVWIWGFTTTYNLANNWVNSTANSRAYDNAPGGNLSISEYMPKVQSMANTLGIDPDQLAPKVEKFCFVPTYSSLDLSTNNFYEDMTPASGNTTSTVVDASNNALLYQPTTAGSSLTSFNYFSAPNFSATNGSVWNEEHPVPTAHSGVAMVTALLGIPYSVFQVNELSTLSDKSFNFGSNYNLLPNIKLTTGGLIYNDVTVTNSESLLINGEETLGFSTLPASIPPDVNSTFIVNTRGAKCSQDGKTITINAYSNLILGSDNDNRNGVLEVVSGSKVELNSYANVKLYNQSKIIMKSGSVLVIHPDVNIELADDNSVIEFEPGSKLKLESGAMFTFMGDGFVRIMGGNPSYNNMVTFESTGGLIQFVGAGKNDKVLEIVSSSFSENKITFPTGIDKLSVINGKVEVDNCDVQFSCNTEITYSKVERVGGFVNLTFDNNYFSSVTDYYDIKLKNYANCEYYNGIISGELEGWMIGSGSDKLTLNNMTFNGIESNGLYVYDSRTDISSVSFFHNHIPIRFEAMSYPTYFTNVTINNPAPMSMPISGGNGLYFEGASNGGYLHLDRCRILNQKASTLHVDNAQLSLTCTVVNPHAEAYNNSSVYLSNGSTLVLDPSIVSLAGNSDLTGKVHTIVCENAFDLNLDNGQSNLSTIQQDAFHGNLQALYDPLTSQFNATNNYWKWGGIPTQTNHYYEFFDGASRQFGMGSNVSVNGTPHLSTPPNLDNCLWQETEPIGGGQSKRNNNNFEATFASSASGIVYQNNILSNSIYSLMNSAEDSIGLENKINAASNILNTHYTTSTPNLKRAMNILYQKTMEHSGRLVEKSKSSVTKNRVGDKMYQIQSALLAQNQFSKHERFKFEMDRVFALRLQKKHNQALSLLNSLSIDTTYNAYTSYINKWLCKLENERQLYSGAISMVDFRSNINNCSFSTNANIIQNKLTTVNEFISNKSSNRFDWAVYPNPANDYLKLHLSAKDSKEVKLTLYSIDGRVVHTEKLNSNNSTKIIDVSNVATGTYILEIMHSDFKEVKRVSIIH